MNSAEMRVQLYENLKRSGITDKMKVNFFLVYIFIILFKTYYNFFIVFYLIKIINNIKKSQLRSCIVQELLKNTKLSGGGTSGFTNIFENDIPQKTFMESKVLTKTINSLIIGYLKASNYEFTLSVFLPECGMSKNDEV